MSVSKNNEFQQGGGTMGSGTLLICGLLSAIISSTKRENTMNSYSLFKKGL
jgi:hypothetical protein